MNFEKWMGPIDPEIDMTGYNRMKRAYKAGMANQKDIDIGIALGSISSGHSEQAMSGRIAKAIRNQKEAE